MNKVRIAKHLIILSAVRAMGGQAVLNGVMMRGENAYAVAVRRADDSIDTKVFDVPSFAQKFAKVPLVRGVMGLGESMALGYRALMHSADIAMKDEEEKLRKEELNHHSRSHASQRSLEDDSTPDETSRSSEEKKAIGKVTVGISVTFSIVFFVALFIVAPLLASKWFTNLFNLSHWQGFIVESVLRLVIFLGYLSLVALMPDIKRVFQYHGAEHKAIAAYENDVVLTPESAQQFTTAHVRCGTNFLLIVMVMSIVFYAGIAAFFPHLPLWGTLLSRVVIIPLIAAVSYEIIRGAASRMKHLWVRVLIRPGLWLQKVTTRQPTNEQCEVAIDSLTSVFTEEQIQEVASRSLRQAPSSWQTIEPVRQAIAA
jgi:uncharacterized protein YqhQ